MKIARFAKGEGLPMYGFVQEEGGRKIAAELCGNPFCGDAAPSGGKSYLSDVRLLAPNFPLKIFCCDAFENFLLKPATAAVGPDDVLSIPSWSKGVQIRPAIGVIAASAMKNCPPREVEKRILGVACALVSSAISDKGEAFNTAFDNSLALGPWIETGIDPDARMSFDGGEPESVRELLSRALKGMSLISTFSTLLPGDMVVVESRLSKKACAQGEAKVEIEGLGYLKAHIRKEEAEAS